MTPTGRRDCLDRLSLSQHRLAALLEVGERTVRDWMTGRREAPPEIDEWLQRRADAMEADPPPHPPKSRLAQ